MTEEEEKISDSSKTHANRFFANETKWMHCQRYLHLYTWISNVITLSRRKHNSFQSSQSIKMAAPNLPKSAFWHPFTCHKPFHLPKALSPATNPFTYSILLHIF